MSTSFHRIAALGAIVVGSAVIPAAAAADCTPGFTEVSSGGFGNRFNLYAWSMQVFNDRLYVGTFNQTTGGEIWAFDGTQWVQVLNQSLSTTGNKGFRSMVIFNGYLYAGTFNAAFGADLWRTADGVNWHKIVSGGFGDANNTAVRGVAVFQNQLYIGMQNGSDSGGKMYRSSDGLTFQPVSVDGFGDPTNVSMHSMAVYRKQLYVGTKNMDTWLQVWRTSDGDHYEQLVGPNAAVPSGFGIVANNAVMSMYVYNNALYFGTGNFDTAGDPVNGFSVMRTFDGTTYRTINNNGAGDYQNRFAWRFIGYEDHLWLGVGNFNVQGGEGGQAWRSPSGKPGTWEVMVGPGGAYYDYGFGNWMNWGVRSFAEYQGNLYIGTAQCWAPWCAPYVTGTEIWRWSGESCPAVVH